MSWAAAELRRREKAMIAEQHRIFVATKDADVSDTINNFAKWLEQQREAERANGWRAIRR